MKLSHRILPRNTLYDSSVSFDVSRPLAFMHVPKTSGVSMIQGLMATLTPTNVVTGFDGSLFLTDDDLNGIHESIRREIYGSCSALPKRADLVAGHFAFATLKGAYPHAQFLTILREPLSRLLSLWLYWRQLTDIDLMPWGSLAERVRLSRRPLAEFLSEPTLAHQTDNVLLRMLLWPHPLIAQNQFLDPAHDRHLLRRAMAQLQQFDFVDFVENGKLADRLEKWLGCCFHHETRNETLAIPQPYRSPLKGELTAQAYESLCDRCRVDLQLWTSVVAHIAPDCNIGMLRRHTVLANVSRYSVLMV